MRKKNTTNNFYPLVLLLILGGSFGPGKARFFRLAADQVFSDREPGCGRKDSS